MKIYANSAPAGNPLAPYVNSESWVKIIDTDFDDVWYIKIIKMTDSDIEYYAMDEDHLTPDSHPIYPNLGQFYQYHHVNRESLERFWGRTEVPTPIETMQDDEVFDTILEHYDPYNPDQKVPNTKSQPRERTTAASIINKIVGKDLWVRAKETNTAHNFYYIKVISMSEFQIAYLPVHSSYLTENPRSTFKNLQEFNQWNFVHREAPEEFYNHWEITEPIELLSDNEVLGHVVEEYK